MIAAIASSLPQSCAFEDFERSYKKYMLYLPEEKVVQKKITDFFNVQSKKETALRSISHWKVRTKHNTYKTCAAKPVDHQNLYIDKEKGQYDLRYLFTKSCRSVLTPYELLNS